MALSTKKCIRTELRDIGTQKEGRYRKRSIFYVFNCVNCNKEIAFTYTDLRKVSGRCRECADKDTGIKSCIRNRIRPYEALYNKFIYDRDRVKQSSDISYEDFLEFTKIKECIYCNDEVTWAEYCLSKNGSRYNLDRKDNNVGYLKNNVVVCCWKCNELKGNRFTFEEMLFIIQKLKEFREGD